MPGRCSERTTVIHNWVAPLEPDLLAEHLIAQHLPPPTWTVALNQTGPTVIHALRVLHRLAADRPDLQPALDQTLNHQLAQLVERAIHQAQATTTAQVLVTGDQLAAVLAEVTTTATLDIDQLGPVLATLDRLPTTNLILGPLTLTLNLKAVDTYRRLADGNPAAYLPDLAMSLNNVSVDLGALGRRDEA